MLSANSRIKQTRQKLVTLPLAEDAPARDSIGEHETAPDTALADLDDGLPDAALTTGVAHGNAAGIRAADHMLSFTGEA